MSSATTSDKLEILYDETQHCTASRALASAAVSIDACSATGGRGRDLSPGDLVGAGLASCMLFAMGVVAGRDGLDLRGTRVTVNVDLNRQRIQGIELEFVLPPGLSSADRAKLERAAEMCPIKSSFHPETRISARFDGRPREARSSLGEAATRCAPLARSGCCGPR